MICYLVGGLEFNLLFHSKNEMKKTKKKTESTNSTNYKLKLCILFLYGCGYETCADVNEEGE